MDHTIVFHTISLAKKVRKTIEAKLDIPFSYSQASTLLTIDSQNGISQKEIADRLHLEPASIVSLIDELEKLKLVNRNDDTDRRKYQLVLTEKGKQITNNIKSQTNELENQLKINLSKNQVKEFLNSLDTISKILDTFEQKIISKGGEK